MLDKYLIKNGTLLSILNGEEKHADILVEDGIVTKIAENIEAAGAEVIDAEGAYVCVGWLDSHCHFANFGINPLDDLLRQGVTYALDLGSMGPENYAGALICALCPTCISRAGDAAEHRIARTLTHRMISTEKP